MRPGRAADHSSPSSAAVMEEYSYTSTHPLGHTGPVTGSLYLLHVPAQVCIQFQSKTMHILLLFDEEMSGNDAINHKVH